MNSFAVSSRQPADIRGFTLIETTLAIGMLGLFISMLLLMNSNVLGLLRTSKDNVTASQALQERIEMMRIANWAQITDATYLANDVMAANTGSISSLPRTVETITVAAYPANPSAPVAKVTRKNGVTQIVSSSSSLLTEKMVRVDLEITWQGFPRKRQRFRATTALIAKGGITK